MLFSDEFKVGRRRADDWFDPVVDVDTKLFVDPFLIFKDQDAQWQGAHAELIAHFNRCFHLIAEGNRNPRSTPYKKAIALLTFPEPREFCLGYTRAGTRGAGGGKVYAQLIAQAMEAAIERGLADLRHFEELGILNEGIGPDRISDFTCNILKSRFIAYTKRVISRHRLATSTFSIPAAAFDQTRVGWRTEAHDLVANPHNKRSILLVPERFLSQLPTLNAEDWWEDYEASRLATDMNYEIMGKVDKKTIVEAARRNLDRVRQWTTDRESAEGRPYNLGSDPSGVYQWEAASRDYAARRPLAITAPADDATFFGVIELIISEFTRYVEEQRGWTLLWNDGYTADKPEEAAQLAFMGLARAWCKANNIVVDREVELGRGPVDFKFSNGYSRRALIEFKKLHNGKFWNGLKAQLPSYQESDDCRDAWYVAIQYFTTGVSKSRRTELASYGRQIHVQGRVTRIRLIDATPKESASKLKATDDTDEDNETQQ